MNIPSNLPRTTSRPENHRKQMETNEQTNGNHGKTTVEYTPKKGVASTIICNDPTRSITGPSPIFAKSWWKVGVTSTGHRVRN